MTSRTERIAQLLIAHGVDYMAPEDELPDFVAQIIATAVPPMMNTQDVANRLRRHPNTVISWRDRGKHEFSEPAGRFGSGAPYWAADVIEEWATDHPELLGPE